MERARRTSIEGPKRSYGEPSPTKAFASSSDREYEARLEAIAREMMEKVERRDRMFHFKTYKQCFVGKVIVNSLSLLTHARLCRSHEVFVFTGRQGYELTRCAPMLRHNCFCRMLSSSLSGQDMQQTWLKPWQSAML